jgi:hypothetical protein
MRLVRLAAAIGAALLLCGCLPVTTKSPIGATVGTKADPELFGVWRGAPEKKGDAPAFIVFAKNSDGSTTAILASSSESKEGDWQEFLVRPATLGDHSFLNVRETRVNGEVADDELAGEPFPLLYTIKNNTLKMVMLDEKKVAEAIKSGAIAGTVEPGEYGDVHITADSATQDAFFQTPAGLALFSGQPLIMKRID